MVTAIGARLGGKSTERLDRKICSALRQLWTNQFDVRLVLIQPELGPRSATEPKLRQGLGF